MCTTREFQHVCHWHISNARIMLRILIYLIYTSTNPDSELLFTFQNYSSIKILFSRVASNPLQFLPRSFRPWISRAKNGILYVANEANFLRGEHVLSLCKCSNWSTCNLTVASYETITLNPNKSVFSIYIAT